MFHHYLQQSFNFEPETTVLEVKQVHTYMHLCIQTYM